MSKLNLQIYLLWASSQLHECGIKQNKLSGSVLTPVMLGWVTAFVCTCVYLYIYIYTHTHTQLYYIYIYTHTHTHTHTYTPGYVCMSLWIKSGFPDLPFQDGHKLVVRTNLVICSVTNGVFTADSVCAHLLHCLLLGTMFLNTFP